MSAFEMTIEELDAKRTTRSLRERVEEVLADAFPEGLLSLRGARRGAEVGFGAYLAVGAILGLVGALDPSRAASTAGFFSFRWAVTFTGAGMALFNLGISLWNLLAGLWDATITPEGLRWLGYTLTDRARLAWVAKRDILDMKLAPADRAYFLSVIDKAEFVSEIRDAISMAQAVERPHPV